MKTAVVVPNWNSEAFLRDCLDSLLSQTVPATIVVVDNGSTDSSRAILESYGDRLVRIYREKNYGFTGGVNPGITYAIEHNYDAVALFNNDAIAEASWLEELQGELKSGIGIVTSCIATHDRRFIDSTGEYLTVWGLPYPRSRHRALSAAPVNTELIFAASGGATLYSVPMLKEIGLFDEDFFAYYEDVDISFRAQLYGWRVAINPRAIAYHRINATSKRMRRGFTTYQTFKNLPIMLKKNVPKGLRRHIYPRFLLAYTAFFVSAIVRGDGLSTLKGIFKHIALIPKKNRERKVIQTHKKVSNEYIWSILTHDLPENATKLKKLRTLWWKLRGKK